MAIVRQTGIYHFRKRIPDRLKPIFGKRELWRSLNTCNRKEAIAKAGLLNFHLQGTFDMLCELEKQIEKQQAAVQRLTDAGVAEDHITAQIAILQDLIARYRKQVESVPWVKIFITPQVKKLSGELFLGTAFPDDSVMQISASGIVRREILNYPTSLIHAISMERAVETFFHECWHICSKKLPAHMYDQCAEVVKNAHFLGDPDYMDTTEERLARCF